MSLDGLRAWIGEVERKLGMRTRVFLVLATIAIGGAGAAIYLAIDTREDAVSESDVQALQERLEAGIGGGGATSGASTAQLEAELNALEAEVQELRGGGGGSTGSDQGDGGGSGANGSGDSTGGGAAGDASAGTSDGAATVPGGAKGKARLQELLEQAEEENKKAEEAE